MWTEIGSSSSERTNSTLVFTTLSNDVIVRDPSLSSKSEEMILTSSEISKYLGGSSFRILLLCIDPRLHDAFSTHQQSDNCILIVDVGKLCVIRFNASTLRIESATYLLGLRVPSTCYEFPHLLPENYHENEIRYETCPKVVNSSIHVTRRFVFALDHETRKSILGWDVETGHLCARIRSQDEIQDISTSSDSMWIAILNRRRSLCVVNLDEYFQAFPNDNDTDTLLCESRDDDDDDDSDEKQDLMHTVEKELNGFIVMSFIQNEESAMKKDDLSVIKRIMDNLHSDSQFTFLENNTLIIRSSHEIYAHDTVRILSLQNKTRLIFTNISHSYRSDSHREEKTNETQFSGTQEILVQHKYSSHLTSYP